MSAARVALPSASALITINVSYHHRTGVVTIWTVLPELPSVGAVIRSEVEFAVALGEIIILI